MAEPKVDAETAASEVLRICEAYHVDVDTEHMGEREAEAFQHNCEALKRSVMAGRLELGDDGLAVYRGGGREFKFAKPTGATFLVLDKFPGAMSRANAVAEQLTASNPGTIAKLPAREWQECVALVNLFL